MKKTLILIITFFALISPTYANKVGDLSIKQLNNNVEKLKNDKETLELQNKIYSQDYASLSNFFRVNISEEKLKEIKSQIDIYYNNLSSLENYLQKETNTWKINTIKEDIIQEKVKLYKFIIVYVDNTKIEQYSDFVRYNVQSDKQRKDILQEITQTQQALAEKVNHFQNQALQNKQQLENEIFAASAQRIKQRVQEIEANPNYKNIKKEVKSWIYQNLINQLNEKIIQIQNWKLTQDYKTLRINILKQIIGEIKDRI